LLAALFLGRGASVTFADPVQGEVGQTAVQERLNRIRADLFSGTANPNDAIRELKEILAIDPQSADAHLLLGLAYQAEGSPAFLAEAIAELRQAIAANPDSAPARLYLAQVYLDLGRTARAREELQALMTVAPNSPQVLGMLGEAERQLGNPQRGLELTKQALTADGSFAQARFYQALALLDLGKRDEAITELERVVQSGVRAVDPYLTLGTAYLDSARVDDGLKLLDRAAQMNPNRSDVRIQLARGYRLKGSLPQAEEQLKLAAANGKALASPFTQRQTELDIFLEAGLIKLQERELDAAREGFTQALAIDPNNGPANRGMAEVLLLRGSYKQAADYAARAAKAGAPLPEDKRKLLQSKLQGAAGPGK
jgi:Tfp pilus assembly protein PilF